MSEHTPSQAEGEPEPGEAQGRQPPRTTPSQAEGEDTAVPDTDESDPGDAAQRAERARKGGKPGLAQHLREEPRTPIQEEFDR
ncbi:hypothetical protein AB0N17_20835 [Streptomyces sp. NPDC051133]|uniref:hypothetical protein n=1 Tax=Streptomyces sp. NPDC051133 TaxID=3155521 RepID=UPI003449FB22